MMDFLSEQYVKFTSSLSGILRRKEGQTLVEYALLLVLIAIVVIAAVRVIGGRANNTYSAIGSALQ